MRLTSFVGRYVYGGNTPGTGVTGDTGIGQGIVWGSIQATPQVSKTNTLSSTGIMSQDITSVGTSRSASAGCGFSTNKCIVYGGRNDAGIFTSITNIFGNTGIMEADITSSGPGASYRSGCRYGSGLAKFVYGQNNTAAINLQTSVSALGVASGSTTTSRTARAEAASCSYGTTGTGVLAHGTNNFVPTYFTNSNLISNTGVVAADVATTGQRTAAMGASYGVDKGMIFSGAPTFISSAVTLLRKLVSNTGVLAADTTAAGATGRRAGVGIGLSGATNSVYGNIAMFTMGYGVSVVPLTTDSLFSDTGVWGKIQTTVGTPRYNTPSWLTFG